MFIKPSLECSVIPNLCNASRILKKLSRHPDGLKVATLAREQSLPVPRRLTAAELSQLMGHLEHTL